MREELRAGLARRLQDPELAEDIVHDVFLRVHDRADQLEDTDRVRAWIARVAHRAMLDALRRRRPQVEVPESLPHEGAEDDEFSASVHSALRRMLDRLDESDREALWATEWEGRSQVEMAAEWGLSVSGAKSRVQRARRRLRELLLDCCHFELDARGRVTDMIPRRRADCDCARCD
jgi:RNA polymerase sigma-70 factor (ECF subfamily)